MGAGHPLFEGLPLEARQKFEEAAETLRKGPVLLSSYRLMVQVNGEEKVNNRDCWQLVLLPDINSISSVQYSRPRIAVDKETGQVLHAENLDQKIPIRIEKLGELFFPVEIQFGYPLPLLPIMENQPSNATNGYYRLAVTMETTTTGRITKAHLTAGTRELFNAQQRWLPGAKWWNEYEINDINRGITVKAKRVDFQP